ncbi:S1 family peptidase [Acinetobacter bereziniae]|uniref:S1 family peptidase n=1 Tax=Acinetobacter bereziniae TaxID=106648 RepID=UPI0025752ED0|nr:serine protease [Acinetobacter bereziniae]MDM1784246.1 trypsin-like peptidase domain-containing protein [Acinetobacter bereziniae]
MREYISDQLYYSTFKIDGNNSIGTGFFYFHDFGNGLAKVFLITNRHVVEPSQSGSIVFHSSKNAYPHKELDLSKRVTVTLNAAQWQQWWKFHPDSDVDIAVLDFTEIEHKLTQRSQDIYYKGLNNKQLIKEDDYPDIQSIQQVFYVGYPQGLIDNHNLLPIARSGYTASPIKFDFNGKREFLIDSAVYPGSSGSPVCIINEGTPFVDRNNTLKMDAVRFIFLGVLTSVQAQSVPNNPKEVKHYLNLGVVIKSECITEVIMHHFTVHPVSGGTTT